MEHVERIGNSRVLSVRREGRFVLKVLESAMDVATTAPGSDEAKELIRTMKERDEKLISEEKKHKKNKNRPIRRESYSDEINNI